MAKFTIVVGHPDPDEARLCRALARAYADGAQAAGHEVRWIDVARLEFPWLREARDFAEGEPPEAIRAAQADIAWADRLAFFFPLWIGDMPALLKAFVEQTFRPGFAMAYGNGKGFPSGLLGGKSARIVVTMGMPAMFYRTRFGAHAIENVKLNLKMCGVSPVRDTLLGGAGDLCERSVRRRLHAMAALACRDGRPAGERASHPVAGTIATVAASAIGGYLAYAGAAWLRFGASRRDASSLDAMMPSYDVRFERATTVRAPAADTFDVMSNTELERSPLVAALFRARALLMRAKSDGANGVKKGEGLLDELGRIGWVVLDLKPGKEIVFGAVTQPWQAAPTFHGFAKEAFEQFDAPGFVKIAFTLQVEPRDEATCLVRTETRVATTDAASRARFRRYWAFLSPGIELIRVALLAQVKAEAERRAHARAS